MEEQEVALELAPIHTGRASIMHPVPPSLLCRDLPFHPLRGLCLRPTLHDLRPLEVGVKSILRGPEVNITLVPLPKNSRVFSVIGKTKNQCKTYISIYLFI